MGTMCKLSMTLGALVSTAAVLGLETSPQDSPKTRFVELAGSSISRKIGRQPEYRSSIPRYALFVFGERGATRMWAVLDESETDSGRFDVLYLDRNATPSSR